MGIGLAAASVADSNGIIAFGSGDPSVVMQSSLTSPASVTAVSGGSITGSPRFDPINGMLPGATGGVYFSRNFPDTANAGQLSFEVQRRLISQPSPDQISGGVGGSQGFNHLADGWLTLVSIGAASGAPFAGLGLTDLAALGGGCAQTGFIGLGLHSAGKSDFVRVTLSWTGDSCDLYVDGLLENTVSGTAAGVDVGTIAVGYSPPDSYREQNYYIRNLVLSNRPVRFPVHPQLSTVVIYGDSFASQSNPYLIGSTHFDATAGFQLIRDMNNAGMSIGRVVLKDYPGQVLNKHPDTNQASFQLGTNRFGGTADKLTDVVNANADYVIVMGGTNDATGDAAERGAVAPSFAGDLLSMCRTILDNPRTKGVIVQTLMSAKGNATYATPTFVSHVAAVNAIIRALPRTWDSTYPAEIGKIKVVDTFTATGGEAAAPNMENGTLTGALNDLHPAAFASVTSGDLIAGALQSFLATSGAIAVTGCTTDQNGVILQPGATLTVNLGGATACTGYGQYNVAQSLTLDKPTLHVVLTNGFVPAPGQSFKILSWATLSGTFGAITLPPLPAGLAWDSSGLYRTGSVSVERIPAPSIRISSGGNQSFSAGKSAAPVVFAVEGTGPLTVTAVSSNPALVPNSAVSISPGCGSSALACSATIAVTVGQTGSATLTLQAQDAYGQKGTATAAVQVNLAANSGGGGGSVDLVALSGLAGLAALRCRKILRHRAVPQGAGCHR
jgi:lysophospholipase L1-like esterase